MSYIVAKCYIATWNNNNKKFDKTWALQIISVQSFSRVRLFDTEWTAAHQASLSITNSRSPHNPCPSSRWCHPTISSFFLPFSSCPQSFPASGSFPMSQMTIVHDFMSIYYEPCIILSDFLALIHLNFIKLCTYIISIL